MARDILSEFGEEADKPQAARATNGGCPDVKALPYYMPVGPIGLNNRSVTLGGSVYKAGSQGRSSLYGDGGAGAPGITRLGGENEGKGTNG